MIWTPTAIGLILDIIGFTIVLTVGGFDVGSNNITWSQEQLLSKPLKYIGAFLIILGFSLQLYGTQI